MLCLTLLPFRASGDQKTWRRGLQNLWPLCASAPIMVLGVALALQPPKFM